MGLDVYLYPRADAEANKLHNEASEAFYDREDYDRLSEDEKRRLRDAIPPYVPQEDVPSAQYPDHLFNRRYLRSSYNDGGFNHAVPDFLGSVGETSYPHAHGSLYWIFEPMNREWDGDAGELTTDDVSRLRECHRRAEQVADELRKCDPLRTLTVAGNMFSSPPTTTPDQALAWAREQLATSGERSLNGWWSNLTGEFFGETGPTIIAACPGPATFGESGVHLVYRASGEVFDSYIQSAEIVCEFIDEAIGLIERDGSVTMSWSG